MLVFFPEPGTWQAPWALLLTSFMLAAPYTGVCCMLQCVVLSTEKSEMGKPNYFQRSQMVNAGWGVGRLIMKHNRSKVSEWQLSWRHCQDMQPGQGDPGAVLAGWVPVSWVDVGCRDWKDI